MAERRRTRSTVDEKEPAAKGRPARRRDPEPADRGGPDAVDAEEAEFAEGGEPEDTDDEFAEDDEPELANDVDAGSARDEEPGGADGGRRDGVRAERAMGPSLTAKQAAREALRQILELTGRPVEGITEVERTEDGWMVGVEVIEDRRIPSSADILAIYKTAIDAEGELMSYRRLRRYSRGRGDEGS
jgi:Gas vesicle synthesis protein GvpO